MFDAKAAWREMRSVMALNVPPEEAQRVLTFLDELQEKHTKTRLGTRRFYFQPRKADSTKESSDDE
jgi:hypothetical protein